MSNTIRNVSFVGAGNMGCFNATKAACAGYRVTLYDVNEAVLDHARLLCQGYIDYFVGTAYSSEEGAPGILAAMVFTGDFAQASAEADLVSESVFEQLAIKREVHRKLDASCPAHTILTTNSSFLLGSDIENAVTRGDRFAAMHSYMGSPLVDIVASGRTSAATLQALETYTRSLQAVPLMLKKEYPGYVLNAILGPLLGMAITLVAEGFGSVEQVDRAWMSYRSASMGPMGIIDIIGLGLIQSGWKNRPANTIDAGLRDRVLAILDRMIAANQLGASTGKGFYSYPEPAFAQPRFLDQEPVVEALYHPLMTVWIASAIKVADADVADPTEIDRAWMVGTSLAQGPFAALKTVGTEFFITLLEALVAAGGFDPDDAYRVCHYLKKMA
ncbi:MAG: 3-hydroxyacyl-CoA dehydrogenase NAD-binding domain-containing protein [Haliea sp.]|nr:3-hydroxyacyl-CoA dehydrogenase NAD-binding domain-containing protein [Haliea sp.]